MPDHVKPKSEPPEVSDEAVASIRRLAAKAWEGILDEDLRRKFDYESFVYGYAIGASQMSTLVKE